VERKVSRINSRGREKERELVKKILRRRVLPAQAVHHCNEGEGRRGGKVE
jgi:hypothetical protein